MRFCNALSVHEGLSPVYSFGAVVEWDRATEGYRLPTEAEWEHACRAGTDGPRYGDLDEIAWHRGNSGERIHEVGGKRPNAWGLHDMIGNAWDWCWDVYDAQVYGPYRVLRGGGWFDEHWSCRASSGAEATRPTAATMSGSAWSAPAERPRGLSCWRWSKRVWCRLCAGNGRAHAGLLTGTGPVLLRQ